MKAWVVCVALALCAIPVPIDAADAFAGTCVMTAGTYNQILRCGPYATLQSGSYRVFRNRTVRLGASDWMAKTRTVVGPAIRQSP